MAQIDSISNSYGAYSKHAIEQEIKKGKSLTTGIVDEMSKKSKTNGGKKADGAHGAGNVRRNNVNTLADLVQKLLSNQADNWTKANYLELDEKDILKIKSLVERGTPVSPEIQEAAKEAISEDGPWGVEAVSDRLVDFAIALSGGDKSKYEILKDSIEKGFKEAEKLWGGELPQISKDTYEATMKKLDEYFLDTEEVKAEAEE